MRWQDFEEFVQEIFNKHGYETQFRVVFRDEEGKSEIDVIAEKFGKIIAIDAKKYSEGWYRVSALKSQARKHFNRCRRFSRLKRSDVIPVIVSFIDDSLFLHSGCIVIPIDRLNDFILNIDTYLAEFEF
jgi:Holliday junction resolvase-like predicted endonuclease